MRGTARLIWIVVALALVAAPLGLPPFAMTLLTEAVILGLFAMSLDLMFGYTRLVSFGHAAAYGFGAYACGWMLLHTGMPLLFAVFAAGLLSGVMAIGVGWICTLATGVSFSMLTLAFAQLLYAISFKWTSVTGGSDGLAGIPRTIGPFGFAALSSKTGFYYLALACLVGGVLLCAPLGRSPFGAGLRGICQKQAQNPGPPALGGGAARLAGKGANAAAPRPKPPPLQDRRGGGVLRARRTGRRPLRAVRRLRQHRAPVLAAVGPGAHHGDRRRRWNAGR